MVQCRKRPLEFAGSVIASVSSAEEVREGGGVGGIKEIAESLLFSLEEVEVITSISTSSSVDGGVEIFDGGEVGCHGCLSCLPVLAPWEISDTFDGEIRAGLTLEGVNDSRWLFGALNGAFG